MGKLPASLCCTGKSYSCKLWKSMGPFIQARDCRIKLLPRDLCQYLAAFLHKRWINISLSQCHIFIQRILISTKEAQWAKEMYLSSFLCPMPNGGSCATIISASCKNSGAPLKSCVSVRLKCPGEEQVCVTPHSEAAPELRISLSVLDTTNFLGIKCRPWLCKRVENLECWIECCSPFSRKDQEWAIPILLSCLRACREGTPEGMQSPVHHKTWILLQGYC